MVFLVLILHDNSFDTLTVKQCEIMINDDVLLYSATNEDIACEQLLQYLLAVVGGIDLRQSIA